MSSCSEHSFWKSKLNFLRSVGLKMKLMSFILIYENPDFHSAQHFSRSGMVRSLTNPSQDVIWATRLNRLLKVRGYSLLLQEMSCLSRSQRLIWKALRLDTSLTFFTSELHQNQWTGSLRPDHQISNPILPYSLCFTERNLAASSFIPSHFAKEVLWIQRMAWGYLQTGTRIRARIGWEYL